MYNKKHVKKLLGVFEKEMNMDIKKLQNGSDIRGVAMEGIEGQQVNLTHEAAIKIGKGFSAWIKAHLNTDSPRIAIGRDSRLSGEELAHDIARGLASCGAKITMLGIASTPAMFMTTVMEGYEYDASVMVTASHLPFNRNGFKFFTKNGGLEKSDIAEVLGYAADADDAAPLDANADILDFMPIYGSHLADKIKAAAEVGELPLKGFKIVVDAGNGAGGFFVEQVLKPLGADTEGSRFLEPDGSFPNHIPNPEDEHAMQSIREAVLENNADLGIIFDTDVDRAGAVLPDGSELNRNKLIAMLSAILLRDHPGTTIVTDSVTSSGLAEFIEAHGGIHHRFKRGYKNVINEAIRLNKNGQDSQLAIETSGHGALKENYFLDDGAYLMVKLLIELAKSRNGAPVSALIDGLKEPADAAELRMNIISEDFKAYGSQVLDELSKYAQGREDWHIEPMSFEGVRVNVLDGWFLLRMSLHDPLMPLNIESDSEGGAVKIAKELFAFLKNCDQLDLSPIKAFIGC